MQVVQHNDFVSHAVIGGAKPIDFTVSNDASLMNILSKSLYSDQMLAVVRETLCNMWDAHVEAGCTDTAAVVDLSDDELTIRDFGNGIPDNLIGPIYGTYGGSTKKHDGQQTGGFGLGCKSPFAYTDHFEVTSWCQGIMTVYNLSKSAAEVQGKPAIIPIVSAPTTETGLQVRIKLVTKHDRERFETLIKRIIQNGDMNVIFNGVKADRLPFAEMKQDFMIVKHKMIETPQRILLRYGHVIYPIDKTNAFSKQYTQAIELLDKLSKSWNDPHYLVFQAPANLVSITPSREALAMEESTINTITSLLDAFLAETKTKIEKGCFDLLERSISSVWLSNKPAVLWEDFDKFPNIPPAPKLGRIITNVDDLVLQYASYSYPSFDGFKKKDKELRYKALIESGLFDRKQIQSLWDLYLQHEKPAEKDKEGNLIKVMTGKEWWTKYIYAPMLVAIKNDEAMHIDKLFAYSMDHESNRYHSEMKLMAGGQIELKTTLDYTPWLRKLVILAHNRLDFAERARQFPMMTHWYGNVQELFLYTVARSPKKVDAARAFFAKQGYTILDLTVAQTWEHQEVAAPIKKEYVSRARRTGIPTLESCLIPMTAEIRAGQINMTLPGLEEEQLTLTPEFVLKASYKSDTHHLPNFSSAVSMFIIGKWGKVGGFVVNQNQEEKYLKMGAVTCEDFLLDKILEEVKTNPRIRESLGFMWERSKIIMQKVSWSSRYEYAHEHSFLAAVYADKDLVDYFGLTQTMNKEDQLFWKMLDELKSESKTGSRSQMKEINEELATIPVQPAVENLFDQIRQSHLLQVFDTDMVVAIMTKDKANFDTSGITSKHRQMLRDMLLEAIEA